MCCPCLDLAEHPGGSLWTPWHSLSSPSISLPSKSPRLTSEDFYTEHAVTHQATGWHLRVRQAMVHRQASWAVLAEGTTRVLKMARGENGCQAFRAHDMYDTGNSLPSGKNGISQYLENQTSLTMTPSHSGPLENYRKAVLPKTSVLLPRSHFLKVPSPPNTATGEQSTHSCILRGHTPSSIESPKFPMPPYSVQDRF